ncbi:lipase maturation factor [Elysia marginata]|uniref:Lipase maturation factor n=1 Tax=Elysia marginata TaxID=1093978 RepID=A0AAV4FSC3_9GAST|nr:lipase maturation factor [Elysia marginata]
MLIIMTGNYNFFNLLTITLCIGLLDDNFFLFAKSSTYHRANKKSSPKGLGSRLQDILRVSIPLAVVSYMAYMTVKLFALSVDTKNYSVNSRIVFTKKQFYQWLEQIMPITIYLGVASLGLEVLIALLRSVLYERGVFRKAFCTAATVVFSLVAVFMFTISLVPHSYVDNQAHQSLPKYAKTWHSKLEPFEITNSYGLFRT